MEEFVRARADTRDLLLRRPGRAVEVTVENPLVAVLALPGGVEGVVEDRQRRPDAGIAGNQLLRRPGRAVEAAVEQPLIAELAPVISGVAVGIATAAALVRFYNWCREIRGSADSATRSCNKT